MNLTQRQLRMFVTTAATGNISRASEALHISQPALTRALHAFEQQMGAPLFARTTRKLALTPEGLQFLPTAQRLLHDLNAAAQALQARTTGLQGRVTLAVGSAFGSTLLPAMLGAFRKTHPGVQVSVADDNSEGITRRVRQAEVDLGIGTPVGDIGALDCQRLLSAQLGLLANPAHFPLKARLSAADVARLPLLKEGADTSIMQVLRLQGSAVVAQMDSGIEVSSLSIQLALARAGVGVAVLSALGASHRDAQGLRFVPLRPPAQRELFLMRRRDRPASVAERALAAAIWQGLSAEGLLPGVRLAAGPAGGEDG